MHAIKRNRKLRQLRFTLDGAPTHTSEGKSTDSKTHRPTMNMLQYIIDNKIKTFGFNNENLNNSQYRSDVGYSSNSMDFQSDEKLFNYIKKEGQILVSYLPEAERNIENVMKCYQRAYDETPQQYIDNWVRLTWKQRKGCIKANGGYSKYFLKKN